MASLKETKGRIASVQSTQKITSAMKMISSAKLHKAQAAVQGMLPYAAKLSSILDSLIADMGEQATSPLLRVSPVKRRAVIVFSSNSSLCGAFNSNVFKQLKESLDKTAATCDTEIYAFGKKIGKAATKEGYNVVVTHESVVDHPDLMLIQEVANTLMQRFTRGEIDEVQLIYHHFHSTAVQRLATKQLLPIIINPTGTPQESAQPNHSNGIIYPDYIIEPERNVVLSQLFPQTVTLQLFAALLDSIASEHAARMTAMQIASDNAEDLLQELKLQYNKSRQQAITTELLDIIGGSVQ